MTTYLVRGSLSLTLEMVGMIVSISVILPKHADTLLMISQTVYFSQIALQFQQKDSPYIKTPKEFAVIHRSYHILIFFKSIIIVREHFLLADVLKNSEYLKVKTEKLLDPWGVRMCDCRIISNLRETL